MDEPLCSNCAATLDYLTYDEYGEVFCTSCGAELQMSKTELLALQDEHRSGLIQ